MLNRLNRIGDPETIDALHQKGAMFKTTTLLFRYQLVSRGPSRFAVVVSSKIQKTAVARNRLRRRISEAIRAQLQSIRQPVVALVSARAALSGKEIPFGELVKGVNDFIKNLDRHAK